MLSDPRAMRNATIAPFSTSWGGWCQNTVPSGWNFSATASVQALSS
ncbi:hypothetical protein [Gordonia aichiensis]